MANVTFASFTAEASPVVGDYLVGYRSAVAGGERRTTITSLLSVFQGASANLSSVNQNLGTSSSPSFAGMTVGALTSGRVTFAGTSGVLTDSSALTFTTSANPGAPNRTLKIGSNVGDSQLLIVGGSTAGNTANSFNFELHDGSDVLTQAAVLGFDLGLSRWYNSYWSTLSSAYVESSHFDPATNVTTFTNGAAAPQFTSTVATGTAPFVVASTTLVANLHAATADLATSVTTNANLTGAVTSTGNATVLGSFTGAALATALSTALPETKGGTNQTTYTTGDILFASAANTLSKKAQGANGTFLGVSGGVLDYYTPAGGGNVSNSGTPVAGQAAEWTSATVIQGVTVTGSGSYVKATSPTLVTPALGAATATSINGNTFTTGTYTLTGTAAKTLTFTNSLTLSGTDGTTMTFPTTSATLARTDAANTFTGTQTVGALVATTLNGNTFTTGTYTLTGTAGKTLTFNNSITLAGTDATVMTFPTTTATIARTDAAQTFTGVQTMTSPAFTTSVTTGSTSFTAFAGATTLMTIGGTGASASSFFPSTLETTSSTTGAIRTSGGISAAKSGWFGVDLTVAGKSGFGLGSGNSTFVGIAAGTTSASSLRMAHGVAPTSPVNGDFWTTTAGLFGRINGATVAYGAGSGTVTVVSAGSLTSTALVTGGGTTTLQTPAATATMDSSGNISTPGSVTTGAGGSVAGTVGLGQGTLPSVGTTSVQLVAPTSVTSYNIVFEGSAGSTGFLLGTVSGTTVTLSKVASSGSGSVAMTTSATFVTPVLGTPTSGNLSNCTVDGTNLVGFRGIPQNSQSTAYTTVLADAGKHILHPTADNNARTFTIDSNANVAYVIGTALTFINQINTVTIAITSDTLTLFAGAGTGTTGSRTLAAGGTATAVKVASTSWIITGVGLT